MNKVTALGPRRGTITAVFLLSASLTGCASIETGSQNDGNVARDDAALAMTSLLGGEICKP